MIDLHCHILPGLDDGPGTMEGTLEMCRSLVADGVGTVVATPHMCTDLYDVTCEQIMGGVKALRHEIEALGIPLAVEPGADVLLTTDTCKLLRDGKVMTVADGGKYLLLELPQDVLPRRLAELLFEIQLQGVTPIITHPERNYEVQNSPGSLGPLVEGGSLVQITAAGIEGSFGRTVRLCTEELLRRRLAHLVASDAHSHGTRPPGLSRARAIVEKMLSSEVAAFIFDEAPSLILRGENFEPPEVVAHPRRKRKWWIFGKA